MRRMYVAHPYMGCESNKESVEGIIRVLTKNNPETLFVSPIHALGFLYNDVEYETGMKWCIELLRMCGCLVLCPGWMHSRGCTIEHQYAIEHKIPIYFVTENGNFIIEKN